MLINAGPAKTVQTWQNTTMYVETTFFGADCFQLSLTMLKSAVMMALASSNVSTLELIITGRWSFRWPYSLVVFLLSIRLCRFSSGSIVELDAVWIFGSLAPVTKHSPCSLSYMSLQYNRLLMWLLHLSKSVANLCPMPTFEHSTGSHMTNSVRRCRHKKRHCTSIINVTPKVLIYSQPNRGIMWIVQYALRSLRQNLHHWTRNNAELLITKLLSVPSSFS